MISSDQLEKVKRVFQLYKDGHIPAPPQHVVHPSLNRDSKENYLYLTLSCSINYQRNSPALWKSALETYMDSETRYLFSPEIVSSTSMDLIRESMVKHKLALQPNKHPQIWSTICETLTDKFHGDPQAIISAADYSIPKTLGILRQNKRGFPYLNGLKLSNYWLFILSIFTDVKYVDAEELSIIPDTHIIKASIQLGLVAPNADSRVVDEVWRPILKVLKISPGDMHSALWLWSRNKFRPAVE
jgi:hypothetical protein